MLLATAESMNERREVPFLRVLSKLNRNHPDRLAELLDTKFINHVATYVVDPSNRGVIVWERRWKTAKYGEWSAFGGCNASRSLIEAMNSLRLELMDESGIVTTSSDCSFRYSPLCILDNVLLQVIAADGINVEKLWSLEVARSSTFVDHDVEVVSSYDRRRYGHVNFVFVIVLR